MPALVIMAKLKALKRIISLATSLVICFGVANAYPFGVERPAAAKTLAEIQAERDANKKKIEEYETQLKALAGQQDKNNEYQQTLQKQINLFRDNIKSLNAEIESINQEITAAENDIAALDLSIKDMEKKIDDGIEQFKARLYSMYVSNDSTLANVLLGSSSFYDMVAKAEMLNRIADYDDKLIDGIMNNIDEMKENKNTLSFQMRTLEMKKEEQEIRKKEKNKELESYTEKMKLTQSEIDRVEREKAALQSDIDELNAANAALDAEDAKIQEAIRREQEEAQKKWEEEQKKNQQLTGGNPVIIPPTNGGTFAWPTPGYWMITSNFGSRWGRLHGGIDIGDGGIHGGAVVASRSGTVISVNNSCTHDFYKTYSCGCGGGYGNYVTIAHDGTFSTNYAHLLAACVSVGEYVQQGQVIGYVGCTGYSMGSHLHFEIYVNGYRQDPLAYVSP